MKKVLGALLLVTIFALVPLTVSAEELLDTGEIERIESRIRELQALEANLEARMRDLEALEVRLNAHQVSPNLQNVNSNWQYPENHWGFGGGWCWDESGNWTGRGGRGARWR